MACLDFDLAVRGVKRWADARAAETKLVPAPAPSKEPRTAVPRHATLREVLALDDDEEAEAADDFGDLDLSAYEIGFGDA